MQLRPHPCPWSREVHSLSFTLHDPRAVLDLAAQLKLTLPASLHGAVAKRQQEFLAGRCAASLALQAAGSSERVVGINDDRSPRWPAGFIGGITHCEGFVAAAVAPRGTLRGVGLDSEKIMAETVAMSIKDDIARVQEQQLLAALNGAHGEDVFYTLLFSAKESIYKCLYPTVQRFFDFLAAEIIHVDMTQQTFRFVLREALHESLPQGFEGEGSFLIEEGLVHTALEWP